MWSAIAAAGASIIGGAMSSSAAGDAADAQREASAASIAEQRRQYDQTRQDNAPFRDTGVAASLRSRQLMGLDNNYTGADSGSLLRNFSANDMAADPVYSSGYNFAQKNAADSINSRALASGSYDSGATLKALQAQGVNVANQYGNDAYNRYNTNNTNIYNRLAGTSGAGQTATNTVTAAGANMANNVSGSYDAAGNARAAGIVGGANAWGQGLAGVGTAANNYQSNQNFQALLARSQPRGYTGMGGTMNDGWTGY